MPPLPGPGDKPWRDTWGQAVHDRVQPATETTVGVVELATATEANDGLDATRVITPATMAGYVDQEISKLPTADLSAVPAYVWQASSGTWPARTTVTSDPTRPVVWVGYPGNTTPPSSGGTGAVVERDFYKQRNLA